MNQFHNMKKCNKNIFLLLIPKFESFQYSYDYETETKELILLLLKYTKLLNMGNKVTYSIPYEKTFRFQLNVFKENIHDFIALKPCNKSTFNKWLIKNTKTDIKIFLYSIIYDICHYIDLNIQLNQNYFMFYNLIDFLVEKCIYIVKLSQNTKKEIIHQYINVLIQIKNKFESNVNENISLEDLIQRLYQVNDYDKFYLFNK